MSSTPARSQHDAALDLPRRIFEDVEFYFKATDIPTPLPRGWRRDFSAVTPMRGIVLGGGRQELSVEVTVTPQPLLDDAGVVAAP